MPQELLYFLGKLSVQLISSIYKGASQSFLVFPFLLYNEDNPLEFVFEAHVHLLFQNFFLMETADVMHEVNEFSLLAHGDEKWKWSKSLLVQFHTESIPRIDGKYISRGLK